MTPAAVALADTNWQFLYCSAIVITNCSQIYIITVLTPKRAQLNSGSAVLHLCSRCSFFWIHRAVPLYFLLLHLHKYISDGDFFKAWLFLNADCRNSKLLVLPVSFHEMVLNFIFESPDYSYVCEWLESSYPPVGTDIKYFYNKQPSNKQRCYNFNASKHKKVNTQWCLEDYWSLVSWHNLMHFLVVAAELWLGRYNHIREDVRWGLNCS